MSRYTVELRELLENGFDIGLKNYPIWDEKHRDELNQKIINHYKYREIGFETPGRFKDELNIRMNEIMPYYIKLYATTLFEYDPITIVDYKEEYTLERDTDKDNTINTNTNELAKSNGTTTVDGESTIENHTENDTTVSENKTNSNGKNVEIDTPQTPLGDINMNNFTSASKITLNENETNNTSKANDVGDSNSKTTDDVTTTLESSIENSTDSESNEKGKESMLEKYIKQVKGKYGGTSFQALIEKERQLIIDVDMMIVERLNDLFMLVY